MWLFDEQIYSNMSIFTEETPKIFRGMALHKLIRLVSMTLGSNGYLNFMGNEFGHPEWIDFPREGNNWSYKYCRRQWDLSSRTDLRYHQLNNFDHMMLSLDTKFGVLSAKHQYVRTSRDDDKILVYERGDLLFVFNWNPTKSFEKYPIYCKYAKKANFVLTTDDKNVGGHDRVTHQSYDLENY
jgi:1,4-alpha-glucan branching enzyme